MSAWFGKWNDGMRDLQGSRKFYSSQARDEFLEPFCHVFEIAGSSAFYQDIGLEFVLPMVVAEGLDWHFAVELCRMRIQSMLYMMRLDEDTSVGPTSP